MKKLILLTTIFTFILGCKKKTEGIDSLAVLKQLHAVYENGEISKCEYEGQLVYGCGRNAYDAAALIYDTTGQQIAVCNYAWGPVDSICRKLTNCEVVYRCSNHISGQPPLNKYQL